MKKNLVTLILAVFFASSVYASEPAQIMLMGTFHFKDPGKDIVKLKDINIFTEESQQYLEDFSKRLAEFKPTRVLLEYNPANHEVLNQRYRDYLTDQYELGANEIYQLGFRIARQAGLLAVQSFDNRDVEWQAEAMFEYARLHDSPEMQAFNDAIASDTREREQARTNKNLRGLLMDTNDDDADRSNMDLYLATNSIDAGDGYAGADAAASWWRRNFRMYANIQKVAQPGERIIVIGGAGHMAILKQFLAIDRRLLGVKVDGYF